MRLEEWRGKKLFQRFNIPIPKGVVVKKIDDIKKSTFDPCIVKAQVLEGRRGKRGLIKKCKKSQLQSTVKNFFSQGIAAVLIEQKVKIDKELYLSLTINRSAKCLTLIYSEHGGIDIEELAMKDSSKFITVNFFTFNKKEIKHKLQNVLLTDKIISFAHKMYRIMKKNDATLVEINPLAISKNILIAVDSKVIIDDNAIYKYPQLQQIAQERLTSVEKDAKKSQLQYVELKGNIAVIGNGAGLVLATLDVLNYYNGKPANFLDIGGGANVEKMEHALEVVVEKKSVRGIFINIFGGITRCDDIARGIIEFKHHHHITLPIVIRMIGTNENAGKKMLEKEGIHVIDSMEKGAQKIVKLVQ